MDYVVAVGAFPALLAILCVGAGLLVDRLAGRVLPAALLPAVGWATLICVSQITTRKDTLSDATPVILVVVALAGYATDYRRVLGWVARVRDGVEPLVAGIVTYAIAIAPVALLGRVSMAAYLKDSTPGTHVRGAEDLITRGHSLVSEPMTSDGLQVARYFDNAYPSGGHTLLGGAGKLVGTDLLWLFQPLLAVAFAVGAPAVWVLGRRLGFGRVLALVAAIVASVPAITYAYALQGSLKEVALLPVLAALPALLADAPAWVPRGWRAVLPLAVLCAGGLGAVGFAGAGWVALALAVALIVAVERQRAGRVSWRAIGEGVVALAVVGVVGSLGVLSTLSQSIHVASNFSAGNAVAVADPGNLLGPLRAVQVFGAWVAPDQRLLPDTHLQATYSLIGVVALGVALGVLWLVARKAWTTVLWVLGMAVVWWVLTKRGTDWTDAKLIVLTAPTAVFVAFAGAAWLRERDHGAITSSVLTLVVAGGVLWSDAVLYHNTNPMPTSRYKDLIAIDKKLAGKGPAFMPEFDEYAQAALRRTGYLAPGMGFTPTWARTRVDGSQVGYGTDVNLDEMPLTAIEREPYVVERNSPEQSRPPSNYKLIQSNFNYQVWQRSGPAPGRHLGAGAVGTPAARPASCKAVQRLAHDANQSGTDLVVAKRSPVWSVKAERAQTSPAWVKGPTGNVTLNGPGAMTVRWTAARGGTFRVWLRGDVARPLHLTVDGRSVAGAMGDQSGGPMNYIRPLTIKVGAGRHVLRFARGGGNLMPGDGEPTLIQRIAVEPIGRDITLTRVKPAQWHRLCGETVDWIEVPA